MINSKDFAVANMKRRVFFDLEIIDGEVLMAIVHDAVRLCDKPNGSLARIYAAIVTAVDEYHLPF